MTTNMRALNAAGFKAVKVTAEEFEDGVGTAVGMNYVKGGVWYTEREAREEAGLPLPVFTSEYSWYRYPTATIEDGEEAAREMFAGHNIEVKDAKIVGGNFKCRLVLTWTKIEDFWAFDDAWKTWVNS